jgi:hypothetical protein
MSFWVTAYCHKSVAGLRAKDLLVGIGHRLAFLAEQFPADDPHEDADPAEVLHRLKIAERTRGAFRPQSLNYREDGLFITLDHEGKLDNVVYVVQEEVLPGKLAQMRSPAARRVCDLLAGAVEYVSFALKVCHYTGAGFPLTIAAAATLVEHAGGIIRSGTSSWMVPDGEGVDIILEYDG